MGVQLLLRHCFYMRQAQRRREGGTHLEAWHRKGKGTCDGNAMPRARLSEPVGVRVYHKPGCRRAAARLGRSLSASAMGVLRPYEWLLPHSSHELCARSARCRPAMQRGECESCEA